MVLGVTRLTNGAWSVNCLSAFAQSWAAVGELADSAASALRTVASNRGSQNSGTLGLLVEFGRKLWQLVHRGPRNSDAAG